jgi:hypothetical protein
MVPFCTNKYFDRQMQEGTIWSLGPFLHCMIFNICCRIYQKKVPYGSWHLFVPTILTKSIIWLQFYSTMIQIIIWNSCVFSKCLIQLSHCMFWKSSSVINLNAYVKISYIVSQNQNHSHPIQLWHNHFLSFMLVKWHYNYGTLFG